jgi:hypothetical protein
MRSSSSSSRAGVALLTFALCAACWWVWIADHGLSWRLGLGEMDLPVRVLTIFVFLSLLDQLVQRFAARHTTGDHNTTS